MDFFKDYKSGLRLVANRIESFRTVSVGVFVDVGSVKESSDTNGYSHFIEHMLFKGTAKRTSLQISEEMENIGAVINAYTAKDNTCFYTKSLSTELERCIDVLSDIYFNASFPEDEMEREKTVVLEEIKMCSDTPDDVSQDLIQQALFKNQTLGQTILGLPNNIRYCVRHNLMEFKRRNYCAKSTVVSVCGYFDFDLLDKLIENYFEPYFADVSEMHVEPDVTYDNGFLHRFKKVEQSHLQMAWGSCPSGADDRFASNVLSSILGGGLTSRLFQTIREKNGLAYSVAAYPSYYLKGGSFEIYIGLSPDNNSRVCELLRKEIDLIISCGVSEEEIARAKIQEINSLYMSCENNLTLMRLYGKTMLKRGAMFNADEEVAKINSVTTEKVNSFAKRIFSEKHASSYVGPKIKDFDLISKI